jgi:plasmid rolling circle replication initiator protein Rep
MDKRQLYREYVLKKGLNKFLQDLIDALSQLQEKTNEYIKCHPYAAPLANYNDELKTALAQAETYIEMMIEITPLLEKHFLREVKHELLKGFEKSLKENRRPNE